MTWAKQGLVEESDQSLSLIDEGHLDCKKNELGCRNNANIFAGNLSGPIKATVFTLIAGISSWHEGNLRVCT